MYEPAPWSLLPFGLLLLAIALGPLLFAAWWSRHYGKVALGLGAVTLGYYLIFLPSPARTTVLHIGHEYLGFIALVGALFIVSGGIHITVKGEATPLVNVTFLFLGALLANVLGTTGASMLLIRPWLRMNKYRITAHHVVFFIFIVSNIGGCLTTIGDPPLFLGYLRGIPFWWVAEHCWMIWLVGLAYLLLVFFVIDYRNYLRAPRTVRAELAEPPDHWRFEGLHNVAFLGVILGAVFITRPIFVRELVMMLAAAGSYWTTSRRLHQSNHFNFHPLNEVAILFAGIFATMMPAMDWLQANSHRLGHPTETAFYWGSGLLSSVLDNAPTYLSFLSVLTGGFVDEATVAGVRELLLAGGAGWSTAAEPVKGVYQVLQTFPGAAANALADPESIRVGYILAKTDLNGLLVAISIGAVFFGATTYLGNGPNFMVKSIADQQKAHAPSFTGFIVRYTLPVLIPMLVLVWLLFFRH